MRGLGRTLVVAGAAWLGGPSAAPGQNVPDVLDSVPRLPGEMVPSAEQLRSVVVSAEVETGVAQLGDPSYTVRESATAQLVQGPFRNEEIYAVLAKRELSAEQRHRLLEVLHDRLLHMPRGAVGISMDTRFLPGSVVVVDLIPGLPACDVLQVGDRIIELQGRELKNQIEFVKAVQSQPPGTRITMKVERQAGSQRKRADAGDVPPKTQVLDVEITLGSADLLRDQDGRPITGGVLEDRRRLAGDAQRAYGPRPKLVEVR